MKKIQTYLFSTVKHNRFICGVLVFIALLVSNKSVSQISFPTDSATWVVEYQNFICSPYNIGSLKYSWEGDSVINGNIYQKIKRTTNFYTSGCYYSSFPSTYNFYRQVDDKLFGFDLFVGRDTLLFDFSLDVGDTLRSALSPACELEITNIDSLLLQDGYHRRLYFTNMGCITGTAFIIEGIGSSFGLFDEMVSFESNSSLNCFSSETSTYPTQQECSFVISTENLDSKQTILIAEGEFFIDDNSFREYFIYDLAGKLICNGNIIENRITFFSLNRGLYSLRLQGKNHYMSFKLIKSN